MLTSIFNEPGELDDDRLARRLIELRWGDLHECRPHEAAEIDNYWRRVKERRYSSRIESLNYSNLSCLKRDGQSPLHSGITAVIGGNGVGKSTVAAAVAEVLSVRNGRPLIRVLGSELLSRVFYRGKEIELYSGEREFEGEFYGIPALHLDGLIRLSQRGSLNVIHDDANFAELLEGITPLELSSDDLLLRHIS